MPNPIIVEQSFTVPVAAVWNAVTEHEQMVQWYFENIPDFRPELGFATEFNVSTGERDFLHHWEITEVIPQKKISYTWNYPDYEAEGIVSFELFEQDQNSLLRLSCFGIDNFPQDIPEFT
ncbi:SRPBCC domain-containing protein [Sungkyunkwania multivorans]|uniref:SRPBCC domain-containing protein n=1 Tax=Sungkyunkwania multivorans TaxID=1173618 RepID=A0ABW3CV03_9FLAO